MRGDHRRHLLGLGVRLGLDGNALQVVDDHDQRPVRGLLAISLDERAQVCGGRARHASRASGRGSDRSARCAPARAAGGDWRADRRVRNRSRSSSGRTMCPSTSLRTSWILTDELGDGGIGPAKRRLHGHQPRQQVLLVVLEADVQHVGLAALRHVARHLERHRGLARSLRPADEHQLAGAKAAAKRPIEGTEAKRDGLVLGDLALADLLGQSAEHVERGKRVKDGSVVIDRAIGRRQRRRRMPRPWARSPRAASATRRCGTLSTGSTSGAIGGNGVTGA